MLTLFASRRLLCSLGTRLWQRGYCAGNDGNLSVRLSPTRVLCTPTGVSKGFMTPGMMTLVDMEGNQVAPSRHRRTSEVLLHLAIYRKRPDIHAVVHTHAPHATAFACSRRPLPRGIYPEAEVCLGEVPTVPYTRAGYAPLGEAVTGAIKARTTAVLLANHGAVTFAATAEEAYFKMEMLDSYCQILLHLNSLGSPSRLTKAQLGELSAH